MNKAQDKKEKRDERRKGKDFANSVYTNFPSTPSKLNLVAELIRNNDVAIALLRLQFCNKRAAQKVKKCLESAIANAENNQQMRIENLVVSEVLVGKDKVLKRMMPKARGRGDRINKVSSRLEIKLREKKVISKEDKK